MSSERSDHAHERPPVSVLVPVYNEEERLEQTLQGLLDSVDRIDSAAEVIVVDDGSTDRTPEILRRFPTVRTLRNHTNRGYGASLKRGICAARGEVIVITDADGTYPHERLQDLLGLLTPDSEMVVGWRRGFRARIPLVRRPAKLVLRKLAESLAGYSIPDLNSGLRVFRRELALRHLRLLPDGFSFTTTITLLVASEGGRIVYEPIEYGKRTGRSKFRPVRDTWEMVTLVVRSVLLFNPLRVFVPIALILIAAAIGVLVVALLYAERIPDGTITVLFTAGIQFIMLGLLADLINRRSR